MQGTDQGRRGAMIAGLAASAVAVAPPSAVAQAPRPPRLSVFVLDTYRGRPAAGMKVDCSIEDGDAYRRVKTVTIDATGNTSPPVLTADQMVVGNYEFMLHVADYFRALGVKLPDRPFLNKVPVRFAVFDAKQVFHIPVLLTPWSYITYRGS